MEASFVEVQGIRWFYRENGSGRPLLLVHGNTGSSMWWEKSMSISGCRCVAPDLPNFGRSAALLGEISIDAYAEALASFISALNLTDAVAVGHSLGGTICLSLAGSHPDLLGGLVLVDSSSPRGLVTPESHYPVIELMRRDRALLAKALKAVAPTMTDETFFERLVDDAMLMAGPAWAGNARALASFDATGRFDRWAKPVAVLWGRKDSIISEAMARETAAVFPGARLEILEEVGHSVIVEDPARFCAFLAEFLTAT